MLKDITAPDVVQNNRPNETERKRVSQRSLKFIQGPRLSIFLDTKPEGVGEHFKSNCEDSVVSGTSTFS